MKKIMDDRSENWGLCFVEPTSRTHMNEFTECVSVVWNVKLKFKIVLHGISHD